MAEKLCRILAIAVFTTLKHVGHQFATWILCLVLMTETNGGKNVPDPSKSSPTHLEARGAPVDELDAALGLDGGDGGIHVLGHHVTPVEHAARHVLP
jgi:hypothetical protein